MGGFPRRLGGSVRREFFVGRPAEAQREEERERGVLGRRAHGGKRNKEMRVEVLFSSSARKPPKYTKRTLDVFKQLDARPAIAMPRVSEYAL